MTAATELTRPVAQLSEETFAIEDCRVLVVDDARPVRIALDALLRSIGIEAVEFAEDGLQALERLENAMFDLVLLDIRMPNMDGYEVCRRLRANPLWWDLPILVQTGLESVEDRAKAFHCGATDLVTKPFYAPELLARVRIHLQNRLLIRRLQAYQDRLQEELRLARDMQMELLPSPQAIASLAERHGLAIDSRFEPCTEMGGDFWGLQELDGQRLSVFVVDFSGHGVTAALNTFRLHTLLKQSAPDPADPAAYLTRLNASLAKLLAVGQYATMLYGVIDTEANTFTYAAAASPSVMLGQLDGGRVELGDTSGLPLGVLASAHYENRVLPFPPGSFLFLYSDALTEAVGPDGQAPEEEGIAALLAECRDASAGTSPLPLVLERFYDRSVLPLVDDLTALWVGRPG